MTNSCPTFIIQLPHVYLQHGVNHLFSFIEMSGQSKLHCTSQVPYVVGTVRFFFSLHKALPQLTD